MNARPSATSFPRWEDSPFVPAKSYRRSARVRHHGRGGHPAVTAVVATGLAPVPRVITLLLPSFVTSPEEPGSVTSIVPPVGAGPAHRRPSGPAHVWDKRGADLLDVLLGEHDREVPLERA